MVIRVSSFGRRAIDIVSVALKALAVLAALAACNQPPDDVEVKPTIAEPQLRYSTEYPNIDYATRPPSGRVAELVAAIDDGRTMLTDSGAPGLLDDLLAELEIDPSSQMLVFSQTSLQVQGIGPATPRAIYFNDDTYVAFVQGAETLEIASFDPALGFVFYTLRQGESASAANFERQFGTCLRCHDSYSLTGGGVPRMLVGSGYIDGRGQLVSHEGWIVTTPRTPVRNRWGGWYVTGHHGEQPHLGNIIVTDVAALSDLDALRVGDRQSLEETIDTSPYVTPYSDIVALLVIEHQIDVQNAITRARYDYSNLTARADEAAIDELAEPLVGALLMRDAAGLSDTIEGVSGFREQFEAQGPFDSSGRSLRELDLETRVFRYPLSYLVYSEGFDRLAAPLRQVVYRRVADVLTGIDDSEAFAHLTAEDRNAILEILIDTKPEFAEFAN